MLFKSISKNLKVLLLRTFILSSWKFTTCNCKLWLVVEENSKMSLWECSIQWMTLKLYEKVPLNGNLFHFSRGEKEIKPYLIINKGYPFFPWLIIPHKQIGDVWHTIFKALYNKHLPQGGNVEDNLIGILKKSFKELLLKTNLHLILLTNVVVYYFIIYNMILDGKELDIEALMVQ